MFRLKNIKIKLLLFFLLHLFLLKNVLAIELCPNSPLTALTFDPDIVKNWNSKCFGEIYAPPVLIQRGIFEKGRLNGYGLKQIKNSRSIGLFKNDMLIKGKYFLIDDNSNQFKLSFSGEFINQVPVFGAFYIEDKGVFVGTIDFKSKNPFSKGHLFLKEIDQVDYYENGKATETFETSTFYNKKIQSCYTNSNSPFNEIDKISIYEKKNKQLTKFLDLCMKDMGLNLECSLEYSNKNPNDEIALFEIGNLYTSGIHKLPREPNIKKAEEYYKKSVNKGSNNAKFALAKLLCNSLKKTEINKGKKILTNLISEKYRSLYTGGKKTLELELEYCGKQISLEENILLINTMYEEINEKYEFKSFARDNLNKACFNKNISQPIYDTYIDLLSNQDMYAAYNIYRNIKDILARNDKDYRNLQEYVNMSKLFAKVEGKDYMEYMIKMLHGNKY